MNLLSPFSTRRGIFSLLACMLKGSRRRSHRRSALPFSLTQAAEVMESRTLMTAFTADPSSFPNQDVSDAFPHVHLDNATGFLSNNLKGAVYTAVSSSQQSVTVFSPNSGAGDQTALKWTNPTSSLRATFDNGASDVSLVVKGRSGARAEVVYFDASQNRIGDHSITLPNSGIWNESFHRDGADIVYVFATGTFGSGVEFNSLSYTIDIADTTSPQVSNLSPSAGDTNVALTSNLVLTLSEPVVKGSGNILIKKSSDDSTVQTIAVSGSAVSVSGSVVTINPADFASGTDYYVTIPNTAFKDLSGNAFDGINDSSYWTFSTLANQPGTVSVSVSPATVREDGTTNLIYTFQRTGPTTDDLYLFFDIGGSASLENDYTTEGVVIPWSGPHDGLAVINAGSATRTMIVNPIADTANEPDETVVITLQSALGDYVIGTPSATGTILSGPPRPDLSAGLDIPHPFGAATGTISVNSVVDNLGLAATGSFDVKYYLSSDQEITASDTLLTTVTRNTIAISGNQTWSQSLTLPRNIAAGDYFIGMVLDRANKIVETDETNNLGIALLTIVPGTPKPDLIATGLLTPESSAAGTTFTVDASIDNLGTAASGLFDVKFYLSADDTISPDDLVLTTVTRSTLAAGGSQAWTQSLSLPKTVTEGDYWIGMSVDPASKIAESDETNNRITQGAIPISGPPRPDLAASNLEIPARGAAGGTALVIANVDNLGLVASGTFDVKFYLSVDNEISSSDLLLATVTRSSIVASGNQTWTQSLTLPNTVGDGDYFIGMILDPALRISEVDESNNLFAAGTISLSGPPRPDLAVSGLTLPDVVKAGTTISASAVVENLGTAASGSFDVKFYLSTDDEISTSDTLLKTVTRTTIVAGGSQAWMQSLNIPKPLADGSYWIGMIVDPASRITESDEFNNDFASVPFEIAADPPPVSIATDDSVGNDQFDFAIGYPIIVNQPFQFSIRGHVGPGTGLSVIDGSDGIDRFAINFQRASTIRIELTNLSVNAGMLLDSLTPGVADRSSSNPGLASESITQSFPAGGRADLFISASILCAALPAGATTYTLTVTIT